MQSQINIRSILGNTLDSRDGAIRLFNLVSPDQKDIIFDFSAIDFMSRSFADQFQKEFRKLVSDKGLHISISNAPVQVIDILDAIARTQQTKHRDVLNLPIYSFSKLEQLTNYLQAI
jgi:hypothetical protein